MFILCTLALMGTEDRLTQARSSQQLWARLTWFERIELQVRRGGKRAFCVWVFVIVEIPEDSPHLRKDTCNAEIMLFGVFIKK